MILSSPFGLTAEISFLESNYMNSFGFPHLLSHYLFLILSSIPNLALIHLWFLHRLSVWNRNSAFFRFLVSFHLLHPLLSFLLFSHFPSVFQHNQMTCLHIRPHIRICLQNTDFVLVLSHWIKLHAFLELSPSLQLHSYSLLILFFILLVTVSLLGANTMLLPFLLLSCFSLFLLLLSVVSIFSSFPFVFPTKPPKYIQLRRNDRHRYYRCCKSFRVLGCSNWTPA